MSPQWLQIDGSPNPCTVGINNSKSFSQILCDASIACLFTLRHYDYGLSGHGLMTSSGHAHRSFNKITRNWVTEVHVTPIWWYWYTAANRKFLQELSSIWDGRHNRHGPKKGGGAVPFRGALGTRLIQCGLCGGLLPYQVASSSIQPFGHNSVGCHSLRRNISTNYYFVVEMHTVTVRSDDARYLLKKSTNCLV